MTPGCVATHRGGVGGALGFVNAPSNPQGQQHPQGCVAALPCIGNAPFPTHLRMANISRYLRVFARKGALRYVRKHRRKEHR